MKQLFNQAVKDHPKDKRLQWVNRLLQQQYDEDNSDDEDVDVDNSDDKQSTAPLPFDPTILMDSIITDPSAVLIFYIENTNMLLADREALERQNNKRPRHTLNWVAALRSFAS